MKINNILLILMFNSVVSCFFSCNSKVPQNKELAGYHEKVMLIHDEVMPKMSDINRLGRRLKKLDDKSLTSEIDALLAELEIADEAMMSWMAEYKKPEESNLDEATAYYKEQMVNITTVKNVMLSSINKTEIFLQKNEN